MRGPFEEENPTPPYNDGSVAEDGVKYIDVVEFGNNYFRCTAAGTQNQPVDLDTFTGDGSQVNQGWSVFQYAPDTIYQYLIAKNAFIQSLTAKQITITNDRNEIVAGMADGEFINNNAELSDDSTNGIRIWAGPLGSGGNVAAAPFTVDEQGHLKADVATLSGALYVTDGDDYIKIYTASYKPSTNPTAAPLTWPTIELGAGNDLAVKIGGINGLGQQGFNQFNNDGSGHLANGNISWNANGNLTINGTLNYNEVIGNVEEINITASNVNSTNTIKSNTTFAIITDTSNVNQHKKIYFPQNPQEGKTLFVMGNGSLLNIIPSDTDTAFVYTHNNQGYTDDFGNAVYKYTKHTINNSYNPDIYTYGDLYVWTGNDVSLHQYIYHSGTWYELTTFSEEVYSRE